MEEEFIVAKVFYQEYEARLFMLSLEDEGIESFIGDNIFAGSNPLFTEAVGRIKVRIRKSDEERALPIVKEYDDLNFENPHLKSENIVVQNTKYEPYQAFCPHCESDKVYIQKLGILKSINVILSASVYLPGLFNNNFYCKDCEGTWSE